MIAVFTHRTKDRSGSRKWLKPTSRNQHSPRLEWLEDRLVLSPAPFTAPSVNLDQFANGTPPPTGAIWTNGNLNGNNSTYHEGNVVPFRLALEGLTPGVTDTIHLAYDFTVNGHEAYDFLASYNATESPDILGPGGGAVDSTIRALVNAQGVNNPVTAQFQSDPFPPGSTTAAGLTVSGAQLSAGVPQFLTIYGATNVSVTVPTHSGSTGGMSGGDVIVTFTVTTVPNAPAGAVFMLWGGHIAQSAYWKTTAGLPNGAGQINGSWHMYTQNLTDNGVSFGNTDQKLSIQLSGIVPASPTISTTANPEDVALDGSGSPTLKDSATLADGFNPTGSIIFTLFAPDGTTVLDTETVPVNGNGTYTTPTGFTLPTTRTVTGTYQWVASYSGDSNNTAVSSSKGAEPVTVTAASPTISTTANPGDVTLDGSGSPTLKDSATLADGFNPTGSLTFTLYAPDGTTVLDTETVPVSGNGTYSTPVGHTLPATGTVTGT